MLTGRRENHQSITLPSSVSWKMLAEAVEYIEYGPKVRHPVRLAARMKRLRREFRLHGIQVDFTPINGESTA